ncbi:MAG TPA: type 4a pilus biogenesis protein PilO [Phycisphaerales bacterium]|nr:type 4a pilus biogenesis protein PilO [Phycisphaerales bacterium]
MPIDGDNVIDQTFQAGSPAPAVVGFDGGPQRMPITVDMTGSFHSIFSLIDRAESLPRLIRVASVRINRQPDPDDRPIPKLRATISLEAIYKAQTSAVKDQ